MNAESRLTFYRQETLRADVRDAALTAAQAVLAREGVSASAAVNAAGVDLLLAEGLELHERTDDHYREHGATLRAVNVHEAAKAAAAAEIARLDPANADFAILFSTGA